MTYADGDIYEGQFNNDQRHGQGKFIGKDGYLYDGNWARDLSLPTSPADGDSVKISSNAGYTAYLDAFISADSVDAVDRGFSVERHYYDATCEENCEPITSIASGQEVRVELTIRVENNRRFVRIEDPLPAGADAVDPNLDTSSRESDVEFGYQRGYWGYWYFNRIEFRDEKVVFVSDYLPAGTYQYSYHLQPIVPGEYQIMPTIAKEVFQMEVFGRSQGQILTIIDQ